MNVPEVEELCERLYRDRPSWVVGGSLSRAGTFFLADALLASKAQVVVEIGTATGFSAAVLASVLEWAAARGGVKRDFSITTFDISERWNRDRSRRTGDAARELVPDLLDRVTFCNPTTSADLHTHLEPSSVQFLYIDANHAHPWPTVDLLLALDVLRPGATVVLDDVNLPLVHPEYPDWGAHYLFYDLTIGDKVPGATCDSNGSSVPTMGSFRIEDKTELRTELLRILEGHEWQTKVPEHVAARVRAVADAA